MVARVEEWEAAGLLYEVDDGVAWLRLNRPQKRNAIDRPLRNALLAAIHEVSEDPAAKVAVVTANGTAFSSGADLTQEGGPIEVPPERRRPAPNTARDDGILYGWYRLMEAIWRSETPFIAAVNGVAAGGGCQLALACDLILASEEASFWEVFVRRGLPLEGGGAWILPRAVGLVRAKELALFGEPLPARRAEEWGLINRCVPAGELEDTAREWARKLAALTVPESGPSSPGGPQGGPGPDLSVRVGHIKSQLNQSLEATMYQTFRDEVTLLSLGPGLPPH
jgi:2-(1,2-epoxy-1,2-dihydrophenyl)acetyl-CoA isomerase